MRSALLVGILLAVHGGSLSWAEQAVATQEPMTQDQLQMAHIRRNMNPAADPCEDFYDYACGHWTADEANAVNAVNEATEEDASEEVGLTDTMSVMDGQVDAVLLEALEEMEQSSDEGARLPGFVGSVLQHFRSCSWAEELEPHDYLDLVAEWEELRWPPLKPERRRKSRRRGPAYDWVRMLAVLRRYGFNGVLLEETVLPSFKVPDRPHQIDLDKPVNDEGFKAMARDDIQTTLINLRLSARDTRKFMRFVEDFEKQLLRLAAIGDDDAKSDRRELTLDALAAEERLPHLRRYVEAVVGRQLPGETLVVVQNWAYMRALFAAMERRPATEVGRYLVVRFLYYVSKTWPTAFGGLECVTHLRTLMPHAVSWLQARGFAGLEEVRATVMELFERIRSRVGAVLRSNRNQLAPDHVAFLQAKLDRLRLNLGNLPRDDAVLEEIYAGLQLGDDGAAFVANHLHLLRQQFEAEHRQLETAPPLPENRISLHFDTFHSSSPFFMQSEHVVVVPLGILQQPVFGRRLHQLFVHSALGFLLGHEIMHSFDTAGLEFDADGVIRGTADEIAANERFNGSVQCLLGQSRHVDEKIADVDGLRLAYEAYFGSNEVGDDLEFTTPDGAALSPERLFFLNFGQFYCGDIDPNPESTEHGEDYERVHRTLAHFDKFARAYNCSLARPMNPPEKCYLWG